MRRRLTKIPFLLPVAVGFLLGMTVTILNGGKGDLLRPENLCQVKTLLAREPNDFYEILKVRGGFAFLILLAGTTYLAPAACMLAALWVGMSMGCFQTAAIVHYGLKGILLLPAATLPQFLAYLPAFYFLLQWSERLYGAIYRKQDWKKGSAASSLVLLLAALALGSFLECRVGLGVLQRTLESF